MEDARCCVCGGMPGAPVRRAKSWLDDVEGTYDVRACSRCGLWMTSPRPDRLELRSVYPEGYHRVVPEPPSTFDAPHGRRLLDVGCGVGNYLAIARAAGWTCSGIEISSEAAEVAQARGFDVVVGDAAELDLGEDAFHQIRCAHVIEHLPDPGRVLRKLARALTRDGEIVVLVPNRLSFTALAFGKYWYHLDVPRHLFHFRPRDLQRLAANSSLTVASVRHTGSSAGVAGSVDCVLAAAAGRRVSRLYANTLARRLARAPSLAFATLRLADVVEYRLVRRPDGHTAELRART